MQFWTFASGSKSNCALVEHGGRGILIDCGMSAKKLESCVAETIGVDKIDAMILTHTHGDHWTVGSIRWLAKNNVKVIKHSQHELPTQDCSNYESEVFSPCDWAKVTPVPLFHDSIATHGFRIETPSGSLCYVADSGAWSKKIARLTRGCDIVAVEANHDPEMQRNSGRHPSLINRVLSFDGHLSNQQCAAFCKEIVGENTKKIVLLHMSSQCNTKELAIGEVSRSTGFDGVVVASGSEVTGPFAA